MFSSVQCKKKREEFSAVVIQYTYTVHTSRTSTSYYVLVRSPTSLTKKRYQYCTVLYCKEVTLVGVVQYLRTALMMAQTFQRRCSKKEQNSLILSFSYDCKQTVRSHKMDLTLYRQCISYYRHKNKNPFGILSTSCFSL